MAPGIDGFKTGYGSAGSALSTSGSIDVSAFVVWCLGCRGQIESFHFL